LEPQNNKKSIRKPLEPGSLVLAYNKSLDSQWGKLFANRWNGPYQIEAQEKGGSYVLKELDGSILKRRFAASQIKPFYARGDLSGGCISRS
jgi:hypothetical protein